jgi:uncharacterized membrane protein
MEKENEPTQPSTADILEEVKRRRAARQQESKSRFVTLANRFVFWLSRHWLAVFNTLAFLYVGLPVLAPILVQLGADGAGLLIYKVYSPLCHQLPQRSWFLFGQKWAYRLPELIERTAAVSGPWDANYIGDATLGYKMAFCQRDFAIYGAIFLSGLVYGLLHHTLDRNVRPLPWWAYLGLGILPMGLDGGFQLLSYGLPLLFPNIAIQPYETTPLMRIITGTLFGWATVWLAYPYVQETMDEVRQSLEQRFER